MSIRYISEYEYLRLSDEMKYGMNILWLIMP